MSSDSCLATEDNKLVRPRGEFSSLLRVAGATKDIFTIKEVMYYLGQYIMQKQLYDKTHQHIVHCSHDALGRVLGVDSFSVKEPGVLFAMVTKNLVAIRSPEVRQTVSGTGELEEVHTESDSSAADRRRRRRRSRSSDPGPSRQVEEEEEENCDDEGVRKRRRSDSLSLTFDDSLSWCVIGGLAGQDRLGQSEDTHSTTDRSDFSVEFEVESLDSDNYDDDDDASLSGDDQVYEVTIFEASDEDSFDEDTEITEADYWRCSACEEMNPPLPRNCNRCWMLRRDWLPENVSPKSLPTKPSTNQSANSDSPAAGEESDGEDVPDGKRGATPLPQESQSDASSSSQELPCSSQELPCSSQELPCSSQELPCSSLSSPDALASPHIPPLERYSSLEQRLPESCLDPCIICQSAPKNGCIVHGRTGHLMACYTCARKLKRRNKLCPVCRQPIQSVVLTYFS